MKKLLLLCIATLLLAACGARRSDPGRVGQMYFSAIMFNLNGSQITPASYKLIDEAAKVYKKNPDVTVEVRGYTDSLGSDKVNLRLSQQRADRVSQALQERGVPAGHIRAKGFGATKPVASNNTPQGREQNRRVEIEFPYPGN